MRSIARSLGRSPSSVCREVQRNGPPLNKAADRPRRSRAKERPAALRSKPMRHTRPSGWKSGGFRIPNRVDISERPPQAGTEKQAGRREADAVVSRKSRAGTAVLAGRKMRFFIAARMKDKTARAMHRAVAGAAWRASGGAAESPITYGNGLENALHEMTNQELGMKSYFYKSRRSWEKGEHREPERDIAEIFSEGTGLALDDTERSR